MLHFGLYSHAMRLEQPPIFIQPPFEEAAIVKCRPAAAQGGKEV